MSKSVTDLLTIENPLVFVGEAKPHIDEQLQTILSETPSWRSAPHISEIMRYAVFAGGGGKRIRPALSLLTAKALGTPLSAVLDPAAAVELIHTYTLIIDDIQDGDDLRRNEPATHVKYGINLSLLAASTLLIEGLSRLQQHLSIPPSMLRKILHKLHAGQEGDINSDTWGDDERSVEAIEFIFRGKTGALFELSCISALGGRPADSMIDQIALIGNEMGVLFQAVDDFLEVAGDQKNTGKAVGKNRGKKLTFMSLFPNVQAAKQSIQKRREILEQKIRTTIPQDDTLVKVLTALVDRNR